MDGLETVLKYLLDNCPIPENTYVARTVMDNHTALVKNELESKQAKLLGSTLQEVKLPELPHHSLHFLVTVNEELHRDGEIEARLGSFVHYFNIYVLMLFFILYFLGGYSQSIHLFQG
jgi:hypothetical protein